MDVNWIILIVACVSIVINIFVLAGNRKPKKHVFSNSTDRRITPEERAYLNTILRQIPEDQPIRIHGWNFSSNRMWNDDVEIDLSNNNINLDNDD